MPDRTEDDRVTINPNEMVDITDLIKECASSLTVGEAVLCDPSSFCLADAMAATQLMDPKMDCCEVAAPQISPWRADADTMLFPRPPPTSLNDPFTPLPWDNLTIPDVTWIALEILVRQQSLLSGASVGESTFTCLYAHNAVLADMKSRLFPSSVVGASLIEKFEALKTGTPGTPAQYILFIVALTLVETTEVVRGIIMNGDVYEEEDFVANTHSIPMFTEREQANSLRLLESAMKTTCELDGQDTDEIKILLSILGFQFAFLSCYAKLARLSANDLSSTVEHMRSISHMAITKLDFLKGILESKLKDGYPEETKALFHKTFDSFVNRPLVGNAPVRKVSFLSPKEAVEALVLITSEIDWTLCNLLSRTTTLGRTMRLLDKVSLAKVNILNRSLIILNLYFENKLLGKYQLQQLIIDDMRQWGHVPAAVISNEHAQSFLSRLSKPLYDTLKLRLLNRNRQRAYIEVVMLPEWISLQHEAHLLDVHYRRENGLDNTTPPHFSQYILSILVQLMDRYVTLGIELGFGYDHVDISFSFWYRDFLLKALLNTLSRSRRSKLEAQAYMIRPPDPTKKTKGKKKNQNKKNGNETPKKTPEDLEDDFEMSVLNLKHNLCVGILRFIVALRQNGILTTPEFKFTSYQRIFEKRFEIFQSIRQPPPLSYDDYLEGSDFSEVTPENLLRTTTGLFQSCKTTAEKLLRDCQLMDETFLPAKQDEIRRLLKVCIGNSVYLLKLQQVVSATETLVPKVEFDFQTHAHFCIVKLFD